MAPLDIITINNNGSIDRLATNDNFDIVQNQDGSKSFQVDHKDGKSQIGQVQTAVSEQNSVDFLVIQDKGIAEQFFEFAADFSTTEYSLDSFSFADGFSTNTITFGESPTGGALGGQVTPIGQFSNIDIGGGRLTSDALWSENSHFHTNGGWIPSGFKGWLKEGNHHFEINNRVGGDRQFMEGNGNRTPNNAYLYDKNTKGYTKYDDKSAEYVGKNKN